jgi:PPK2 family polyphosphate:nucleotide phosphotransferase
MAHDRGYTVSPGKRFRLARLAPDHTGGHDKKRARKLVGPRLEQLNELQERLYSSGERAVLIVLQAMDTGGKDGTIKHVFSAFNPQGVEVTSFKVPSEEELAHDFLWRVHKAVPRRGMVGIFNRSHYEDVLVVRVKELVPEGVWSKRYEQINAFEERLVASGVKIVKLFLHISPDEQAERLRERQERPEKNWKFNPADLEDRGLWKRFRSAYEDALSRCNTEWAPWHVVPADHKWYRNLVVSNILLDTLEGMDLRYPDPPPDLASYVIPDV